MKPLLERTRFAVVLAAALVVALARMAGADNGDPVILGDSNLSATHETAIDNPDINNDMPVIAASDDGAARGLYGSSNQGIGIEGTGGFGGISRD